MSDHFLAGCEGAGTLSCSDPGAYIHNATCSVEVEVEVVMNSGFFATKGKGFAVWGRDPYIQFYAWADLNLPGVTHDELSNAAAANRPA
jgi:hypothetical protein